MKAIFALCVLALLAAPAIAQMPYCHRSGYSMITDCKAAHSAKLALFAKAAKELMIKVTPTSYSCTECGKNTFTIIQQFMDQASFKKYDSWEHNQTEYKKAFVNAMGVNKGLKTCKASGACTKAAMAVHP